MELNPNSTGLSLENQVDGVLGASHRLNRRMGVSHISKSNTEVVWGSQRAFVPASIYELDPPKYKMFETVCSNSRTFRSSSRMHVLAAYC